MSKNFGYYIDLDERGEFSADVRNQKGKTVFEISGFEIFEDGFMKHKEDISGLQDYLVDLGILDQGDKLHDMETFESLPVPTQKKKIKP